MFDWLLMVATIGLSWQACRTPQDGRAAAALLDRSRPGTPREASTVPNHDAVLALMLARGLCADAETFLAGARRAYELIAQAFADGRLAGAGAVLTPAIRADFAGAIMARRRRGESELLALVRVAAVPLDAGIAGEGAWIRVRFDAEAVLATFGADGRVLAGDPCRIARIAETWTFVRALEAEDPNWQLAATEAGDTRQRFPETRQEQA